MTDRLGRYRIVRLLGTGGVAEVYLARLDGPGGFSRPVALKRLKKSYRLEPSYRRQFIAEARVGALLDHPNIVAYFELAEQDKELFIVTEYLHGVSTRKLIQASASRGEFLPVCVGLHAIENLLRALTFAHSANDDRGKPLKLVHRDISPENLFLCLNGAIKLIDFGIAATTIGPRDTQMHVLKGKARYFSPEQAAGRDIGAESDIYSAGLLLYELFTGTPAIRGDDPRAVLEHATSADFEPASAIRPGLPESSVHVLERALAPDVRGRYPSAAHMLRDVRRALHDLAPDDGQLVLAQQLEHYFADELETRRRTIWRDQSTAIVEAADVARSAQTVDRGAQESEDEASHAVSPPAGDRPRYVPMSHGPSRSRYQRSGEDSAAGRRESPPQGQPRYASPDDGPAPPPDSASVTAAEPSSVEEAVVQADDTITEMDAAESGTNEVDAPDDDSAPTINLDRLRRAVSQAYSDDRD